MAAVAIDGIFSDEVFTATELNRRGGTILDRARYRPVTISRNNEQFALLRREQAAKLFGTVNRIVRAVSVMSEAQAAIAGGQISENFSWLKSYDQEDLQSLVSEVLQASRTAVSNDCDWDEVEAVIHEWRESAIVAQSGVLDAAMYTEPQEETPLEYPEELLRRSDEAGAACQTTNE